ncbi:aspergillopepsin [Apiospora sp. TS-2023a]
MNLVALIAALLCACANFALAAPFTELRRQRAAERARARSSSPLILANGSAAATKSRTSTNWSGAYLTGEGFLSVTGEITVPVPKPGTNTAGEDSTASAWVGIGGYTCKDTILQTGIDLNISKLDFVTYDAWFEWFPEVTHTFTDMVIIAGDTITMTVAANGTTGGTATILNQHSGQQKVAEFVWEPDLCQTSVEWIVEDMKKLDGTLYPFANFQNVAFTNTVAQTGSQFLGVKDATVVDIIVDYATAFRTR